MAVYTEVSDEDVATFVAEYDIGRVLALKGIAEGVENSNYLLVTEAGQFILTLYEKRVREADLPFFLGLMEHLSQRGLACPLPVHGRDGMALRRLRGRPAAVVSFLRGLSPRRPHASHCAGVGRVLAQLHQAGEGFTLSRPNDLSVAGWRDLLEKTAAGADSVKPGLADALSAEIDHLEREWPDDLSSGVIHADLFPDNVLFEGNRVSGVIDFYFACTDAFAYDLAVCLNAWCFEADRQFNVTKARQFLRGYRDVRPLPAAEIAALPLLARGAALRFLMTRLYDWLNTPADAFVRRKDPLEYWDKLRFHQAVGSSGEYGLDP